MSPVTKTPTRALARATAVLALAVVLVTVLTGTTAGAAATADAPWSGFGTPVTATAGGAWLGGRTAGTQVVYRLDPGTKVLATAGFAAGTWSGTLAGTGTRTVTALDTARAAWILSKYGTYPYDVQSAAVDVAVRHLTFGGTWALTGTSTKAALAATGRATAIRSFADTMLADSSRYAGPYAVKVTAGPAAPGGQVTVTVTVTATRTGAGIERLPVTLTYPGARPLVLTTAADGSATTSLPAGAIGQHTVTATAGKVPETRLQVRSPTTTRASRVAVAGLKTTVTATAVASVRVIPTSKVIATRSPITTTGSPAGQLTVSGGYASPRTAAATLYGPFDAAADVRCDPTRRAASGSLSVTGDGTYPLPATLTVPRYGYYVWGTAVAADQYNAATTACGGTTLARVAPGLAVAPGSATATPGSPVHGVITATGLPPYAQLATQLGTQLGTQLRALPRAQLRLYGPFATAEDVGCNTTLLLSTVDVALGSSAPTTGPDVRVTRTGYYFWAANLPAGDLHTAAGSSCTATGETLLVRW
ncbi:MAG: hypothetical protein JWQ74_2477 [Marmoricola sp.]|nr:hypothetical protein [Marmoricola sp.]